MTVSKREMILMAKNIKQTNNEFDLSVTELKKKTKPKPKPCFNSEFITPLVVLLAVVYFFEWE